MRVEPVLPSERFYTTAIRWRGNLVPIALGAPFLIPVVWAATQGIWFGAAAGLFAFGIAMRIGMNQFGLVRNAWLKANLGQLHSLFVGIQTDRHMDPVEPHFDVGALSLRPGQLCFSGDRLTVEIERDEVTEVRFQPNPHSWVGLGRFVRVETACGGHLDIELRKYRTLKENFRASSKLKSALESWWKFEKAPDPGEVESLFEDR